MGEQSISNGPRFSVKGSSGSIQFNDGGEDLEATSMANVQVSYNSGGETAKLSSTDIVASNLVTVGSELTAPVATFSNIHLVNKTGSYLNGDYNVINYMGISVIKSNASVYVKGYSTSGVNATQYTLPGLHITSEQGSVRVGIGTDLPTSTLTVNGEVSATSYSGGVYCSFGGSVGFTQSLTDTATKINFTGIGENSGDFTLSSGEVTVSKAGVYSISFNVLTYVTSSADQRSGSFAYLAINDDEVARSRVYMYNRNQTSGATTGSSTTIRTLSANDVLSIYAARDSGDADIVAEKGRTQINVHKIA
jgi:hypothetical protein